MLRWLCALVLVSACTAGCDEDDVQTVISDIDTGADAVLTDTASIDTSPPPDTASGDSNDDAADPDAIADTTSDAAADTRDADTDVLDAKADLTDADATLDVTLDTADGGDADVEGDGDAVDADADVDACGADCVTTAAADFGSAPAPFDRAFYGLTAPEHSGSGAWEIYVEAHFGGSQDCPDEQSPTPDRTLIVSGIVVPWTMDPVTSGVSSTVLDFEGSLLTGGAPFTTATAVEVTVVGGDVCTACVGMVAPSDPDGFVSLDLTATFAEGSVGGHVYATHCDSLDLAP